MQIQKLGELYVSFFKIGGLTFGGGLAMLPMLQREVVTDRGWCTEEEVLDMYAIGQCTPGIIAVNTATYVGYKQAGFFGGLFATLPDRIYFKKLHRPSCRCPCIVRYPHCCMCADAKHGGDHGKKRHCGQVRRCTFYMQLYFGMFHPCSNSSYYRAFRNYRYDC